MISDVFVYLKYWGSWLVIFMFLLILFNETVWQIEREKVETVTDFIFLGSKITVDDDWSNDVN